MAPAMVPSTALNPWKNIMPAPLLLTKKSITVDSTLLKSRRRHLHLLQAVMVSTGSTDRRQSRFDRHQARKGADIIVEGLEIAGVTDVFAYPGGASLEIHKALTRSPIIVNHLLRHEQGEGFAADGYARATGRPGVCVATSGPGATNLVTAIAGAYMDSIPVVAITGQVPLAVMDTNAFQDIPIVEITKRITKHSYLVEDVDQLAVIMKEAFILATNGRPGPVLIDVPQDIQLQEFVPEWDVEVRLPAYHLPPCLATNLQVDQLVGLLHRARRPLLYVGGGCDWAVDELRRFVKLTGIPVTTTMMGLGVFPSNDTLSLQMLGSHGTDHANYAVSRCDLLLAFGVRFDDRATRKLESFASRAVIVHVDIDSAELGKNKTPHLAINADIKMVLGDVNVALGGHCIFDFSAWRDELKLIKSTQLQIDPHGVDTDEIPPRYVIEVLDQLTGGDAIISTGVGQHQIWAAQHYTFKRPRQWLSSAGMGAMGFGLPAAAGAAVGNPGVTVVDIDGDGSFMMNIQELAMIRVETLPVKVLVMNNQNLGMVAQVTDHGDAYLGDPAKPDRIYPDFVMIAKGFDIPAARVTRKNQVREAIKKMLDTPGPYLLDITLPPLCT